MERKHFTNRLMKTTLNIDLKTIIIIVVLAVFLIGGGGAWVKSKFNKINNTLTEQINLNAALNDSITYTVNKYNEEVATKLTLQTNLKNLQKKYDDDSFQLTSENQKLTENQKELVERINNLKDKNNVITAALYDAHFIIDTLLFGAPETIVNDDNSMTLKQDTDSISFDFTVFNAAPISLAKPTPVRFNCLSIPNKTFIVFHWGDKKKYYQRPISFSVTNSSPFVTTSEMDSYIIPEVNYELMHPTAWDKIGNFFKKPAVIIIGGVVLFSGGVYVGVTAF